MARHLPCTTPATALAAALTAALAAIGLTSPARAQSYDEYIPLNMPGFDDPQRGAEILQRPATEYDPLGVHVGDFIVRPHLAEEMSYDSDVLGTHPSVGSALVTTTPQVEIASTSQIHPFTISFGGNNLSYLDQKRQSFTDFNLSIGGSYKLGQDTLTLAASEAYLHQRPTDIDSASLTFPLGFKATDIRARYSTSYLRWTFEPDVEYLGYRFDDDTIGGVSLNEKVRDRDTFAGGLTIHFGSFTERSLVTVVRAIDTRYFAHLGGLARPDSRAYEALAGINYAFSGNLSALLLVGYEVRTFTSSAYPARSSPVAEASIVWTPSGLTSVIGRASRSIESSVGETTTGVTLTQGTLTVEHELRRNWRIQGRSGIEYLEFAAGQVPQTMYNLGASTTYLINRNLQLTGSYNFSYLVSGSSAATNTTLTTANLLQPDTFASTYARHVGMVTLRFAL